MKRRGQNLIEFVIVMPLLVVMIFGIVELALYWRASNTVQSIALQAGSNAANQLVFEHQKSSNVNDIDCTDGDCYNFAVARALNIVQKKQGGLFVDSGFSCANPAGLGTRPYAVYKCVSAQTVKVRGTTLPRLTLYVDYRDPSRKGVITQLIYQYKTLFMGMSFKLPSGKPVVILPRDIELSSTKIQQYVSY